MKLGDIWGACRGPLGPLPYFICKNLTNQLVELGRNDGLDLSHDISKWPHPLPRIMAPWKAPDHGIRRWQGVHCTGRRGANKLPVLGNGTGNWHWLLKVFSFSVRTASWEIVSHWKHCTFVSESVRRMLSTRRKPGQNSQYSSRAGWRNALHYENAVGWGRNKALSFRPVTCFPLKLPLKKILIAEYLCKFTAGKQHKVIQLLFCVALRGLCIVCWRIFVWVCACVCVCVLRGEK